MAEARHLQTESIVLQRVPSWLTEWARAKASAEEATMVTYEFTCKKCGAEFEVSCHMDERKAKAVCPKCGGRKVTQKLSAAFSSPRPSKY